MADGKTHAADSIKAATVITIGAGVLALSVHPVAMGLVVGAWAGFIVTPDIDHHVVTEEQARLYRENRLLGRIWSAYWKPYEWLNPHRGRSHTIPDGTWDRFLLLFWPLILLSLPLVPALGPWVVVWWVAVLVGQIAVDGVHLWRDGLI